MSGGRFTKEIPEFVYFVGQDGNWVQGPYVTKKTGPDARKFKLVEIKDEPKPEKKKKNVGT